MSKHRTGVILPIQTKCAQQDFANSNSNSNFPKHIVIHKEQPNSSVCLWDMVQRGFGVQGTLRLLHLHPAGPSPWGSMTEPWEGAEQENIE